MFDDAKDRRVLLLQGPMGPYFSKLAIELSLLGTQVTKVNFNGGDSAYFSGPNVIAFSGTPHEWPVFVRELMGSQSISDLVLFGDRRELHSVAVAEAHALDIRVHVFEEGYLRPNYVTLEKDGVNARSTIPRDPEFYRQFASVSLERPRRIGHVFWYAAWLAAKYAWSTHLNRKRYPHYRHHRDLHPVREGWRWLTVGAYHKVTWKFRDLRAIHNIAGKMSGKYFLVPLQVHNDFQVRGSVCNSVEAFISEVAQTFATSAPDDTHLVFKHHPLDRPYRNYTQLLDDLREQLGLAGRLHYIADPHLPTLLIHARGTVVLNSTVGLSSLQHGTPTFALGHAVYSVAGLAHQGSLADFLANPKPVDQELISGFSHYLALTNQLPGNFYKSAFLPRLSDAPQGINKRSR